MTTTHMITRNIRKIVPQTMTQSSSWGRFPLSFQREHSVCHTSHASHDLNAPSLHYVNRSGHIYNSSEYTHVPQSSVSFVSVDVVVSSDGDLIMAESEQL